MNEVFVDSAVPLLAAGGAHRLRAASREVMAAVSAGSVRMHASVEMLQEFTHHRMRMGAVPEALLDARDLADMTVVHAFDLEVWQEATRLMQVSAIRGRDAVHAATALLAGFDEIISPDTDFVDVPGLRRIHPADWPVS